MDTREIARRFIRVWTAGHLHLLDELAAPDISVRYSHFPEPVRGREAFRAFLTRSFDSFPDLVTDADEPIVDGDRAAVKWIQSGTHRRAEVSGSMAPIDTPFRVQGVTLYRIQEGLVAEETGIVDNLALFQQLGTVSARRRDR